MIDVWDRVVRFVHWSVAALVLANFFIETGRWHRYAGYLAAALVALRLAWGFTAPGYARFSRWWPGFRKIVTYLRQTIAGQAPRYIGINPMGASMAVLLWLLIAALGVTGWMMGLDAYWGEEWLQELHETSAYVLLGGVAIHVTSVIVVSIKNRENLPKAMLTGKKRSS
ncbi:cytochrome b/b6 domain-containing protein [Noviherbaspirillum sp. UKPF54]|uniref:cytochrome b/b6 domain-containing protein n=1 Tax=Noviherbaspirillum sp. UKPF54 TaxID=2601898 RepID=UPI0011B197C8|nr:cytochrome b/b6 domain-containing protein [Noviherbaspirillum sp. UKPF54]QDZ27318.1 cytochrome B [Noviherbaspirillum sp. UKPF54]